jgi:hypothetical protein
VDQWRGRILVLFALMTQSNVGSARAEPLPAGIPGLSAGASLMQELVKKRLYGAGVRITFPARIESTKR